MNEWFEKYIEIMKQDLPYRERIKQTILLKHDLIMELTNYFFYGIMSNKE